METIINFWNSTGWIDGLLFLACAMGMYYYKCWVDWHFKNKNFDAKFKQTATIQVAPGDKKRSW
jgi:hypothetical protein